MLVLAALTLVTIDARSNGSGVLSSVRAKVSDGFSPLQRATHAALAPIGNFLTGAADYGNLRAENQRLRQQIAALQTEGAAAAADQARADQVMQQQNLAFVNGVPKVTAPIIEAGASNFDNTIMIGKGTASGVAAGQPVVAAGGLVGTVLSASTHVATIRLMTDPSFDVGVRLPGNNIGSAVGEGRLDPLRIEVDTTQNPPPVTKPGQILVTSGLNMEKFPPGIPVGKVVKETRPPGATEPDIEMAPLVDVGQLAYVQVLIWAPPA